MKTSVLILAAGTVALFGFSPEAKADPGFSYPPRFGRLPAVPVPTTHPVVPRTGYIQRGGYSGHSYRGGYSSGGYYGRGHCSTPRLIRTCEISRRQHCMTAFDSCGRPYAVRVTVVTYRDLYSNGTCRTYTRTYR